MEVGPVGRVDVTEELDLQLVDQRVAFRQCPRRRRRELHLESAAIAPVDGAPQESLGLERPHHLVGGLRADEREPGELRRRDAGVLGQHAERRVLAGGETETAGDVVEPSQQRFLELLDQVGGPRERGFRPSRAGGLDDGRHRTLNLYQGP
jgi:hypothetical protein